MEDTKTLLKSDIGIFGKVFIEGKQMPSDIVAASEPGTLSNKRLEAENTSFVDVTDESKSISFDLSSSDSGASTIINVASLAPRAYTFVDQGKDANILLSEGDQIINGTIKIEAGDRSYLLDPSSNKIIVSDGADQGYVSLNKNGLVFKYGDGAEIILDGQKIDVNTSTGLKLNGGIIELSLASDSTPGAITPELYSKIVKDVAVKQEDGTINADINGSSVNFTGLLQGDIQGSMDKTTISKASISNDHLATDANIVDTKLATISTPGKVMNTSTTASPSNKGETIVMRDKNGDFEAGTIRANFIGDLTGNISGSATTLTGTFSGDVGGTQMHLVVNPKAIKDNHVSDDANISDLKLATIKTRGKVANSATSADSENTPFSIVTRDKDGNFEAGTITANITGTSGGFTSYLMGAIKGTQNCTIISDGAITNTHLSTSISIDDSKLNTITTPGKIANSSTTATSKNINGTIVLRSDDGSPISLSDIDVTSMKVYSDDNSLQISIAQTESDLSPGDALIKLSDKKKKLFVGYGDNDSGFIVENDSVSFNTQIIAPISCVGESRLFIEKYLQISKMSESITINSGESARFSDSITFDASLSVPLFYLSSKSSGTIIALQGTLMISLVDGPVTSVVKTNWSGIVNPSLEALGSYVHVESSTPVSSFGGVGVNITPVLTWQEFSDDKMFIQISFAGSSKSGKMSITHLTDILVSADSNGNSVVKISTK